MPYPTVDRLRELFDYDPVEGLLFWRVHRPHIKPGDEAGGYNARSAHMVSVDGQRMAASQIMWALTYGDYPGHRLRTKNGDPKDIRVDNLTRYKEFDSSDDEDIRDHRALKAMHLRQVNAAALKNIQRDHIRWRDYCSADALGQQRILAGYRQELRQRYPELYPSGHLKKPGRPSGRPVF